MGGFTLFERTGRRATLTDAGRALLPHAEAALAAIRDGERAVRERGTSFRLALVGALADSHVVDALRAYTAEHRVDVDLRTATSREVSALVRSGEADLGVRYHPDADFPAERGGSGSYRGLVEHHLAAGLTHPIITTVDSLTAQKRLIEAGLGVALMPLASIREELRIGSLRTVDVAGLDARVPVVAVRRPGGHRTPAADGFLAALTENAFTQDRHHVFRDSPPA